MVTSYRIVKVFSLESFPLYGICTCILYLCLSRPGIDMYMYLREIQDELFISAGGIDVNYLL